MSDPVREAAGGEPRLDHKVELAEQTRVGEVYLRALMRRQLRLSLSVGGALFAALGVQPLLDRVWPDFVRLRVAGVPLAWLVLGLASYPLLVAAGYYYVKHANAIDDEFHELFR